jgi:hypothetical protein
MNDMIFMDNPRLPVICKSSSVYMRVTPSLPQRGRHSKGSIPLTPISEDFVDHLRLSLYGGLPEVAGEKSTKCKEPPRASLQFPARISTEQLKPPCPAVYWRGPEAGSPPKHEILMIFMLWV